MIECDSFTLGLVVAGLCMLVFISVQVAMSRISGTGLSGEGRPSIKTASGITGGSFPGKTGDERTYEVIE